MPNHVKNRLASVIALVAIAAINLFVVSAAIAETNAGSIAEHSDVLMKIIGGLLSVNVVVLTGFVGWLVGNQKELFQRVGAVETAVIVRKELCDERHDD